MKRYLKVLLIIPLFLLSLPIVFIVLLKLPDSFWGCQGFGCFGIIFIIPPLTVFLAVPTSLLFYICIRLIFGNDETNVKNKIKNLVVKIIKLRYFKVLAFITTFVFILLLMKTLMVNFNNKLPKRTSQFPLNQIYSITPSELLHRNTTVAPKVTTQEKISEISLPDENYWVKYRNLKYKFEVKFPQDWFILRDDKNGLRISNKYFDPSLNGSTPVVGEVFIDFYYFHSALENYSDIPIKYTSTEGVDVVKQGRFIAISQSFGIITTKRAHDPNTDKIESTVSRIISTLQFTNELTPTPTSKYPENISDWKTYRSDPNDFSIKYPPNFNLSEKDNTTTIYSEVYECETENTPPYLENIQINASEIKIEIKEYSGNNYEDIWKTVYGFDFYSPQDGQMTIDGKRAYYFYQGAEMTFGRKAILIELTSTTAIQINSWTPILVYKCDDKLDKYSGVADQILSTFQFTK